MLVAALIITTAFICRTEAYRPFQSSLGTLDHSDWFNFGDYNRQFQNNPVSGIEREEHKTSTKRRFLTVRYQNIKIVLHWHIPTKKVRADRSEWRIQCPQNTIMYALFQMNRNANYLLCGKLGPGFQQQPVTIKRIPASKTSGKMVSCLDSYFVNAIECLGFSCSNFGLTCIQLDFIQEFQQYHPLLRHTLRMGHLEIITDRGGEQESIVGSDPIFALACSSAMYCDYKTFSFVQRGTVPILQARGGRWTRQTTGSVLTTQCPKDTISSGASSAEVQCRRLRLYCKKLFPGYRAKQNVQSVNQGTSAYTFDGSISCPDGHYMNKIHCSE